MQSSNSSSNAYPVVVNEAEKGSEGLSRSYEIDFFLSNRLKTISFDKNAARLKCKLEEIRLCRVYVTRGFYLHCIVGGWESNTVSTKGTLQLKFTKILSLAVCQSIN